MRIVDSPECPLCNSTPGAIEHAFLECQEIYMHCGGKLSCVVRYGTTRDTIKSSDSEKIFGIAYKDCIIDTVILLTKKKIYKNR